MPKHRSGGRHVDEDCYSDRYEEERDNGMDDHRSHEIASHE